MHRVGRRVRQTRVRQPTPSSANSSAASRATAEKHGRLIADDACVRYALLDGVAPHNQQIVRGSRLCETIGDNGKPANRYGWTWRNIGSDTRDSIANSTSSGIRCWPSACQDSSGNQGGVLGEQSRSEFPCVLVPEKLNHHWANKTRSSFPNWLLSNSTGQNGCAIKNPVTPGCLSCWIFSFRRKNRLT